MKYQESQRFISLSMHSALEINNSEKKGMGLKLRKEPPVFWWQVPKQAEAASQLRSNTSFQTCSHSLLVELFDHFSGIDHFHKEVKKRKQRNFFVKRRRALDKKVFEWSLNFCATSCINTLVLWFGTTPLLSDRVPWKWCLCHPTTFAHYLFLFCGCWHKILWEVPGFPEKGLVYPGGTHQWLPSWRQQHRKWSGGLQGW